MSEYDGLDKLLGEESQGTNEIIDEKANEILGRVLEYGDGPEFRGWLKRCGMTDHWTDDHICYDRIRGQYIAYDEAGLVYGHFDSYDEARDGLVIYSHYLG